MKGDDLARFESFIARPVEPTACWPWNGATTSAGYAEFTVAGTTVYAHRWSYEQHVGPIPDGLTVDHTCHNADPSCPSGRCPHRRCVNPAHLEAVTLAENTRRARNRTT